MKFLITALTAMLLASPALAGFQGLSGSTNLGIFDGVKCSTGMTCSRVGAKLVMVASPTQSGNLTLTAANAADISLLLQADNSDDNGDDWKITADAATNAFSLLNDTSGSYVSKFSILPTGVITLSNSDTLSNATDDSLIFASEDSHSIFQVKGFEASDASIQLYADEGDDNADKFGLKYSAAGNLTFEINGSAIATMVGSSGNLSLTGSLNGDGGDTLYGFLQSQVATTTTTITASQCGKTFVSDSGDVMTLPEASTVIGCRLTFISGTNDDLDINPNDGTDQIGPVAVPSANITPAAGDAIRITDIGSSVTLEAIGNDLWAVIAFNGAVTDVN